MIVNIIWVLASVVLGFILGRYSTYERGEQVDRKEVQKEEIKWEDDERKAWSVGSPVSGRVTVDREGERPTVVICPEGDQLYAPVGGKVTRLFPMGNALLFSTEFGAEMYIRVGEAKDELMSRYYRPRVVQNEVVGKGKLLLEFDREALEAEGTTADVAVSVENFVYGSDVKLTVGEYVKTGEEILQVKEYQYSERK